MNRIYNLKEYKFFRQTLRRHLTPAEAKLWTYLKNSQLDGRKFRRQHSIGKYILDFYCPSERLAIELDGEVHFNIAAIEYDAERSKYLMQLGIKIIRFENQMVFQQYDYVMETIMSEFGWYEKDHPLPPP
jgi:very-short-patch-repair endonuclease